MTKATEIMQDSQYASGIDYRAVSAGAEVTQDWDNEATIYEFDDESVLVVSGPLVDCYANLAAAKKSSLLNAS